MKNYQILDELVLHKHKVARSCLVKVSLSYLVSVRVNGWPGVLTRWRDIWFKMTHTLRASNQAWHHTKQSSCFGAWVYSRAAYSLGDRYLGACRQKSDFARHHVSDIFSPHIYQSFLLCRSFIVLHAGTSDESRDVVARHVWWYVSRDISPLLNALLY